MKKIVSLVLAVLMAVTLLCGCAKNQSASPSPFVGTWVCDYDPTGFPAQMVLREDGLLLPTASVVYGQQKKLKKSFDWLADIMIYGTLIFLMAMILYI